MKAYHMSQTLQVGDKLKAGYKRNEIRCREVISTLEQSEQCLETTIASMKLQGDEWREYVKWCVEGIFEFVRETEFSFLPSRLLLQCFQHLPCSECCNTARRMLPLLKYRLPMQLFYH